MHAFLSFAPVAAGPGDSDAEKTFQLIQSFSDLISLREDRYLQHGATDIEVCSENQHLRLQILGLEVYTSCSALFSAVGRNALISPSSIRHPIGDA